MSRRIILLACALSAALALYFFGLRRGVESEARPSANAAAPLKGVPQSAPAQLDVPAATAANRDPAAPRTTPHTAVVSSALDAQPEAKKATDAALAWNARGVVLDPSGAPSVGIEVVASPGRDTVLAETRGDGGFEAEVVSEHVTFEARGRGCRTVFAGVAQRQRAEEEAVIVVAPTRRLHGIVRSSAGLALEGAELIVETPWMGIVGFPRTLERSSRLSARWETGAGGRFELDDVPVIPGVPLRVTAEGYKAHELELPEVDTLDLVIELAPSRASADATAPTGRLLYGSVETPSGAFVAGASVYLGGQQTTTNDAGRWELARPVWVPDGSVLAALHTDLGVGTYPDSLAWRGEGDRIGPLRIEIAPNVLAIRGRVLDAVGEPLQGWVVQVLDPTSIDPGTVPSATLEAGGKARSTRSSTAEDGSFAIERLLDRAYDLRAYDPVRFLSIMARKVPAGTTGLELRLADDGLLDALRATVRTPDGAPVERAKVNVQFILERSANGFTWDSGKSAFTDSQGEVELRGIPRRGVNVIVSGTGIVTESLDPGDGGFTGEPLTIEVLRRVDVLVDCSGATPVPNSLQLLDRDGTALQIESRTAQGSSSSTSLQLTDGRAPVVSVSEAARTVVLLRDWQELRRYPIDLVSGEVNRVVPPE